MRKPVESSQDVLETLPKEVQDSQIAPVRDAFVEAATAMFEEYQAAAEYSAHQSDPLTATDIYLEGLARDHERYRASGEEDSSLRDRIFSVSKTVTPEAILEIANEIVSQHTTSKPQLFESELDRMFCCSTSPMFSIGNPQYQDRLYEDDSVANGGYVRPQSSPGACWTFSTDVGRYFVLRIPSLTVADTQFTFVSSSNDTAFISSNSSHTSYFFTNIVTEAEAYELIVSRINRIVGQGIRWQLYVDPNL